MVILVGFEGEVVCKDLSSVISVLSVKSDGSPVEVKEDIPVVLEVVTEESSEVETGMFEQEHSYSLLHRCFEGSKAEFLGHLYFLRSSVPLLRVEHKKYDVQVGSLLSGNRPFVGHLNGLAEGGIKQSLVVVVPIIVDEEPDPSVVDV